MCANWWTAIFIKEWVLQIAIVKNTFKTHNFSLVKEDMNSECLAVVSYLTSRCWSEFGAIKGDS